MYKFKNPALAALAAEVQESWPKFLEPAFSQHSVGDAIADQGCSEKEAVERELTWMKVQVDALLECVRIR